MSFRHNFLVAYNTLENVASKLTLKAPVKNCSRSLFFFFTFSKEIRLFSLKNNEKIFINVVCCSCDCHFKG